MSVYEPARKDEGERVREREGEKEREGERANERRRERERGGERERERKKRDAYTVKKPNAFFLCYITIVYLAAVNSYKLG